MRQWLKGFLAVVVILIGIGFAEVAERAAKIAKWCERVGYRWRSASLSDALEATCDPQEWRK